MNCISPVLIRNKNPANDGFFYQRVPCGKCEACIKQKQSQWFTRLKFEQKFSSDVCFVTLTYDEEHLPENLSVCKKDVQDYHKRLRFYLNDKKIKYFVTSEYGPETHRPHYHGIYFGISPQEFEYFEKAWKNGFVMVSELTDARIRYVCGYIIEKYFVPPGREPLFTLISKGIGIEYFDVYSAWHQSGGILERCYVPDHGNKLSMPRYYKERIFTPAQRAMYAAKLAESEQEKVDSYISKYGVHEAYMQMYESENAFIRKCRKQHKKKKQL